MRLALDDEYAAFSCGNAFFAAIYVAAIFFSSAAGRGIVQNNPS